MLVHRNCRRPARRTRILGLAGCSLLVASIASEGSAAGPGLSLTPDWTAEGETSFGLFGDSVATAGDVNGDGFSDVIVGANNANPGEVFVYGGSASGLSTSPIWFVEDGGQFDAFGASVASAGDVNGDGYDDVVVGSPGGFVFNTPGRALVYHGSAQGLDTSPAWTQASVDPSQNFGFSVAGVGDVDGDGYDDVIVGAPGRFSINPTGQAFVYRGSSAGLSTTPDLVLTGDPNTDFGISVAAAGDVNGDGLSDVIVASRSTTRLYLGSATTILAAPQRIAQASATVSTAGDVNGDGFSDVIIGRGQRVDIYLGSMNGLLTMATAWTAQGNDEFGAAVATAGDVDGDGLGDVIVGAPFGAGEAFVYLGASLDLTGGVVAAPADADWVIAGIQQNDDLGTSVGTAGDVNGDGYSDVIVGAPRFRRQTGGQIQTNIGRALVYRGAGFGPFGTPDTVLGRADWTVAGRASSFLGASVATAGDVNADGYDDVILGAPGFNNNLGRALLFLGSASGMAGGSAVPADSADWIMEGSVPDGSFGSVVSAAGDVNGDGFSDVIVDGMLLFGGIGPLLSTNAGFDVGGSHYRPAGDVNGDGYADVIVYGDPIVDGTLYLGSDSGLSTDPSWQPLPGALGPCETGRLPFASFEFSGAVGAGDVNGDGYDDVIAPGFVLYLGSSSGLSREAVWSEPEWKVDPTTQAPVRPSHARGVAAGDVNGDGFSDVIALDSCKLPPLLYLGSRSGLSPAPAWTAPIPEGGSNLGNNFFDVTVGRAGDVNGDGFSDVIVSYWKPQTGNAPRAASLYLGSSAGLSGGLAATLDDADWTAFDDLFGNGGSSRFPQTGTAGDVDGDGFSDVLIADPFFGDFFNPRQGEVFLYLGNNGKGPSRRIRQLQDDPGVDRPIAVGGLSDSKSAFRIELAALNAGGVRTVGLESEVAPLAAPLDGSNIRRSVGLCEDGTTPCANSTDCTAGQVCDLESSLSCDDATPCTQNADCAGVGSGVCRLELATPLGLPEGPSDPADFYHWRARIITDSPLFPRSPWFSKSGNDITEKKLRTPGNLPAAVFGLLGPAPNERRIVDSGPLTFSWRTGGATRFRIEWSRNFQFAAPVVSIEVQTTDPAWASHRPDDALWQRILRLVQQTGFEPGSIFWRVVPLDGPPAGAGAREVRAIRLAAPRGPIVERPADGSSTILLPTFFWSANHNEQFQIRFSNNSHIGDPRFVVGGSLPDNFFELPPLQQGGFDVPPPWCGRGIVPFDTERTCAWRPSVAEWTQIMALADEQDTVYYVILAKDALGRRTFSPVTRLRILGIGSDASPVTDGTRRSRQRTPMER